MKTRSVLAVAPFVALLAAGCGGEAANQAVGTHGSAANSQAARVLSVASSTGTSRCTVSHLSVRLGTADHAAGSAYRPIVFTNTGSASCTLRGYPGVSYVAPGSGAQVGAAATRDSGTTIRTVTLAPGAHAAALLRLVNYINYPASSCSAKAVSGLRVYPPGSKAAAYVTFATNKKACSTDVEQLDVRAVVKGRTGQ